MLNSYNTSHSHHISNSWSAWLGHQVSGKVQLWWKVHDGKSLTQRRSARPNFNNSIFNTLQRPCHMFIWILKNLKLKLKILILKLWHRGRVPTQTLTIQSSTPFKDLATCTSMYFFYTFITSCSFTLWQFQEVDL